ncbi:hypothetical protein [Streptomyces griseofuscus]|uniref:hypothetical protein n=1 Tax=Streptomyces griseofuscus TaxID=146922 RepID=UPI0033C6B23B
MSTETPRDADGRPLCGWCGGLVPPSRGTKPRIYCKDGCKTRAWEARRLAKQLEEAREAVRQEEAEARPQRLLTAYMKGRKEERELGRVASSRDDAGKSRDDVRATSRDDAKPQVTVPKGRRSGPPQRTWQEILPHLAVPPREQQLSGVDAEPPATTDPR